MTLKSLIPFICGSVLLVSCSTSKTQLPYFTDLTAEEGVLATLQYNPTIQPDDELFISIISPNYPTNTEIYNLPVSNPVNKKNLSQRVVSTPAQQTYTVNSKGDITLPMIGEMHVAGMTTEELQKKLTEIAHREASKDAVVTVELLNFQVVVAGEVNNPKTIEVNKNRFSILDAISAAGDLTPYGERTNVLLIREENGKRVYKRLNLNSSDVLNSPYYYLRQNDYIYVEPNDIREANAKYNQNNSYKLTVISTIVSAASVIASLVIALTVK